MPGAFILSLDCEGKWGIADHLDPRSEAALSDARLRRAYGDILQLLGAAKIPATFAFVGVFAQSREALRVHGETLERFRQAHPEYLNTAVASLNDPRAEGWHGDWAVAAVRNAPIEHEIGLHGVTHIPWTDLTAKEAGDELALLERMGGPVKAAKTFIYPRNMVAHTAVLKRGGIAGFRAATPARSRFASLASEMNIAARSEADGIEEGGLVRIPAGYFVNWQSGLRRAIPRMVSRLRARSILAHAAKHGGVAHFWLHPENIASAPATLQHLKDIVCEAARLRDDGAIQVVTQAQYAAAVCNRLAS